MPTRILHIYGSLSDSKYQSAGLAVFTKAYPSDDPRQFKNKVIDFYDATLSADRTKNTLNDLLSSLKPHVTIGAAGLVNLLASACMKHSRVVIGVPIGSEGYQASSFASVADKPPGNPLACVPPNKSDVAARIALAIAENDFKIYVHESLYEKSRDSKNDDNPKPKTIFEKLDVDHEIVVDDFYGQLETIGSKENMLLILDYDHPEDLERYEQLLEGTNSFIIGVNKKKFNDDQYGDWIAGLSRLDRTMIVGNCRTKNAFWLAALIKSVHNDSLVGKIDEEKRKAKIKGYGPEIERVNNFIDERR